jgi:hypothetical protein
VLSFKSFSGVFPHLAHTNREKEVGIGAVVAWGNHLWTNTYGPHLPHGSSDKLRQIDRNWHVVERPESVGGTPANRMIHRESNQLLIGHHLIDGQAKVRTIDPKKVMPGRLTANARHLEAPEDKVYYLTMENGVYEVDVRTLKVRTIIADPINISKTFLPGYHGKGAYTGSGRVVVSNNGEPNQTYPSGCLASWDGKTWSIIARNQFTEVTGPGGLHGNSADDDRVWAVGWDKKSIRLFSLEDGHWSKFRLPKGSYTHDANHGWNTEWPRIRKVKADLTLMHMHGLFFQFPQTFGRNETAGIKPICTYAKMPVDYDWFNGKLVIGKDDASKFDNDFVQQAQSNLWIGDLNDLKTWGPRSGFGGVWLNDSFDAGEVSEPFLMQGFDRVCLHLVHEGGFDLPVEVQLDNDGRGHWETARTISTGRSAAYQSLVLRSSGAAWVRLVAKGAADKVSAYFHLSCSATPQRISKANGLRHAMKRPPVVTTLQLPRGEAMKLNVFTKEHQFQMDGDLVVQRVESGPEDIAIRKAISISPDPRIEVDSLSAVVKFTDARGERIRLRLPKMDATLDASVNRVRHVREVVTERSMLSLHGSFYELPRPKPGKFINFWQMKPICSHNYQIEDFCSWRGMLVISGASPTFEASNVIPVGETALWLGEVDDLWSFGKPRGIGAVWEETKVQAGEVSDPYLMLGYDQKSLTLVHASQSVTQIDLEIDFLGTGEFWRYRTLSVDPGQPLNFSFPEGFEAHWVRLRARSASTLSAHFTYL